MFGKPESRQMPVLPCRSADLGMLLRAGARIKTQEPEPSSKFRTGTGDMTFEKYIRLRIPS